jgi:chemotaxis signal transduction protein
VEYDINALLLLSPLSTGLIGFLASEEIDIVNLSEEKIRKMHTPKNRPYVIGLVEDKKWSAWVLDLEQLLIFHQAEIEKFHA